MKRARLTVLQSELDAWTPKTGKIGVDRTMTLWRAAYNWGIKRGYADRTPFKIRHRDGAVSAVEFFGDEPRRRRFEGDEATRLLAACGSHLHDLVVAALETCCRKGELLSLQWNQVQWDRNRIVLPAGKTKSKKERGIPMSAVLRALLETRRFGAKPEHDVFGAEDGERIKTVKTAWKLANRRAGIRGLHFHDLRREGASRLLESDALPHFVQAVLGHANISTTSTYLSITDAGMQQIMARVEERRRSA